MLWGISWLNVNMMMADAARMDTEQKLEQENVEEVKLRTKDDLKKFISGD